MKTATRGRVRNIAARLLPSFSAFVGGTAAWLAVDAWIARDASAAAVEQWVALKTTMMIGSSIALVGLDQVIVREPDKTREILRWSLLNVLVVSGTIAVIVSATDYYRNALIGLLSIAGVAGSLLLYAVYRAHLRYSVAQVARDGWKIIFLFLLWPLHFRGSMSVGIVLVVAMAVGIGLVSWQWNSATAEPLRQSLSEVRDYRSAIRAGVPFLMTSFALSMAAYGELLLVNWFGAAGEVQPYFRAGILFSYPALMVSSYATTFLGPAIRQSPVHFSMLLRERWHQIGLALMVAPLVTLALGYAVEPILFPESRTPLWLAGMLSAVAGLRFLYILVSSYVGALARARELWRVTFAYFSAAVATIPFCALAVHLGFPVLQSVAITAAMHWLVRVSVGWRLTLRIANRHTLTAA